MTKSGVIFSQAKVL